MGGDSTFLETLVSVYQTTRCLILEERYRKCERKKIVAKIMSSFKISLAVNLPPIKYKKRMYLRSKVNSTHLCSLQVLHGQTISNVWTISKNDTGVCKNRLLLDRELRSLAVSYIIVCKLLNHVINLNSS